MNKDNILYIIIIVLFMMELGISKGIVNMSNNNIEILNSKINSLDSMYNTLHKSQIKTLKIYDSAFFIKKNDIKIDSRGYFYSKYYRKYKLKK